MRINAVILDMDGLMLDTEPIYKATWQEAAGEVGFLLADSIYATLLGRPTEDCERMLVTEFGPAFPLAGFRLRWQQLWQARVRYGGIPIKEGLFELLALVEDAGLPLAVATSSDAAYTEFSLRHAGLAGRFHLVVTGDQVSRGKPAPDIYLQTARRLDVDAVRCAALEDSYTGVQAASEAGMTTLWVHEGGSPLPAAAHAAFRVLASLNEARQLLATLIGKAAGW